LVCSFSFKKLNHGTTRKNVESTEMRNLFRAFFVPFRGCKVFTIKVERYSMIPTKNAQTKFITD